MYINLDTLYNAAGKWKKFGEDVYNAYVPHHQEVTGFSDNNAENWVYHSESWEQKDYDLFAILYNLPIARQYLDYLYDKRSGQEYLKHHPVDVHDPRRLPGATSSVASVGMSALNYVSSNVSRLYRD